MMGRILAIALDKKVDMALILSYPLTPIPLYFSHIDGFMNKPPKSSLFNVLENPLSVSCNPFIDVYILGGVYLLHLLVDPLLTFGKIASEFFSRMCNMKAKKVDSILDQIISPSIKDMERDHRGDCNRDDTFAISGPN